VALDDVYIGLFFTANILFCVAYVVRDMAYLRAITILAALCTFPYFYFQESPLYSALFWQSAFILINGFNLTVLLLRLRPVVLSDLEEKLHLLVFRLMKKRDLKDLVSKGSWIEIAAGQKIVSQGEFINGLYVLIEGTASVLIDDEKKATLYEGDFVGEMSFITGQSASANVVSEIPVKFLKWNRSELELFYNRNPEMRDAIQSVLGANMAEKLKRTHGNPTRPVPD
jgi:CRP-like cAMP-binding protein